MSTTLKERMEALVQNFNAKKQDLAKVVKQDFKDSIKAIFDKYPTMKSFGWEQFTPYFCDGDVCEFSTNQEGDSLYINGMQVWDTEDDPEIDQKADEYQRTDISSFLGEFGNNDLYLEIFGDHITVTIKRNGKIETEEYEHE